MKTCTKTLIATLGTCGLVATGLANAATITDIGTTAPVTNVFESNDGTSFTRVSTTQTKGQTFTAPQIGASLDGETWGLSAITLQFIQWSISAPTAADLTLEIVSWDGALNAGGATKNSIYSDTTAFTTAIDNGDYFTFDLGTTVDLTEGSNYAFRIQFANGGTNADMRIGVSGNNGADHPGVLWQGANSVKTNQDADFYLAVPEPGSLALLGLGGVLIASRRRRG